MWTSTTSVLHVDPRSVTLHEPAEASGRGSAGGSTGCLTPLANSPDSLRESLYKISVGYCYKSSVWTSPTLEPCVSQASAPYLYGDARKKGRILPENVDLLRMNTLEVSINIY
jgi:hypothetical protein